MNDAASAPGRASMIRLLVLKDWHFMRWPIALYLFLGAVALLLVSTGGEGSFYAGCVLLFTVLISLGIHLAMATIVQERTQQTLPFVMSLPITPGDYTTAKILANVIIFLIPWGALVAGALAVIAGRAAIHDGLIPFALIILTWILVSYTLLLAVALISESEAWSIVAMVFGNLAFQAVLYSVSHLPSIASTMRGDVAVWPADAVLLLAGELAVVALLLALTFFVQNRKTDFI
jgi:ABC-2 type transport system permease protein